jgi:hypothetical protein
MNPEQFLFQHVEPCNTTVPYKLPSAVASSDCGLCTDTIYELNLKLCDEFIRHLKCIRFCDASHYVRYSSSYVLLFACLLLSVSLGRRRDPDVQNTLLSPVLEFANERLVSPETPYRVEEIPVKGKLRARFS